MIVVKKYLIVVIFVCLNNYYKSNLALKKIYKLNLAIRNKKYTTISGGSLGSQVEEERSQIR